MKLMQMLKLTKLRKLLSRAPKPEPEEGIVVKEYLDEVEEAINRGQIKEMLGEVMSDYRGSRVMTSVPSFRGPGVSFSQLSTFPPTQVRNIRKCFARSVDDFIGWRSGYSNQALEAILVEFGGGTAGLLPVCRKAIPTTLITKRDGYKRKVDDKYFVRENDDN